jgi:hypothetical protein
MCWCTQLQRSYGERGILLMYFAGPHNTFQQMHIHKIRLFVEVVVNGGTVTWRLYDLCTRIPLWSVLVGNYRNTGAMNVTFLFG